MGEIFILVLFGVTSVGAFVVGIKGLGLSARTLRHATGRTLDTIGFTLLFLAVNLAVAVIMILAGRAVTGRFVSLYLAVDGTLVVLSALQALTLLWWREG